MSIHNDKHRQVVIIGNGAIGNLLAFHCHLLKLDYAVVTRDEQEIELAVTDTKEKTLSFALPIIPFNLIGQFELIVIPIKAYQVAAFIEQAEVFIQPWQTLVLLHNGMGTIEHIQKRLPCINLIAATTTYGAFKPERNQLAIKGIGETQLGLKNCYQTYCRLLIGIKIFVFHCGLNWL